MKKNKLPSLVTILILTLITGIAWASFEVYRAFTTKSEESVPSAVSNSINPTLDQPTINKIETKIFIDSSQIPDNVVTNSSITIPSQTVQTPAPTATTAATPVASPSGVIQ
jgi:hypothetical protein